MNSLSFAAFSDELMKIAQEEQKPPHPALLVGAGLGGLGVGYGAGHLTAHGLNKLLKSKGGVPSGVLKYGPAAAGLTGLGVATHQAYTWDKARKAMEARRGSEDS